jgi:tetratricopeptide (TPR) repeat protein
VLKGSLGPGELIDVLHRIHDSRRTGVLHLIQGDRFRGLRFRAGEIVNGFSSVREEHMGDVMVRAGILQPADLERADAVLRRERKRMGQVLIELGVLDERGLADALARHGREVLLRAFAERGGAYNFEEAESSEAPNQEETVRLSAGEMIFEVGRRLDDPEAIRHAVGDLQRVLTLVADPLLRLQKIALTPGDAYILSRIDGTSKAEDIVELVGGATDAVLRSLFVLLCAGLIRKVAPAKPVKRVAPRPAPLPPREPEPPPPPPKPTPPPPVVEAAPRPQPPPPDPDSEARQAELQVGEAERLVGEGKFWDAIQLLEELMPRIPERIGRRARFALARAYRRNPKWVKAAEDLLLGIVQAEPTAVEPLVELANLYEEKGLKSRAAAMYRKVIEVDPAHGEACAGVKRLEPEAAAKAGFTGKFKKILTRE